MKQNITNTNLTAIDEKTKKFFSKGSFVWSKSNDIIWMELEKSIEGKKVNPGLRINSYVTKWTIAASIVLLIGLVSFLRFYSKTIITEAGSHLLVQLPDKSTINLNAQSSVEYNPYWWFFKRTVKFEGEGLFEVQKGKKFSVLSKKGTTRVLGTSFNIYSRDEVYRVTCLTGSVKVSSNTNDEVILKPNSKAAVQPNGKIDVILNVETLPEISWKNNIFLFTASPVREVFNEIERQYGVKILASFDNYVLYTGNFSKDQNVEEILGYICPALGFKYIRKTPKVYYIIQSNE